MNNRLIAYIWVVNVGLSVHHGDWGIAAASFSMLLIGLVRIG